MLLRGNDPEEWLVYPNDWWCNWCIVNIGNQWVSLSFIFIASSSGGLDRKWNGKMAGRVKGRKEKANLSTGEPPWII